MKTIIGIAVLAATLWAGIHPPNPSTICGTCGHPKMIHAPGGGQCEYFLNGGGDGCQRFVKR